MDQNLISQAMTDVQRDGLMAHYASFETAFAPYQVTLTPTDVKKLSKLKPEDIGLLELAAQFAQQNPGALPADVNMAEFTQDVNTGRNLTIIHAEAQQKADMVKKSLVAALSDGFASARKIYRVVQAQGRTPQNATFLDAFGARFSRGPREEEPESATPTPAPAP